MDFANAFGSFIDGGRVLLSRDTRMSSPMLPSAVLSSLLSGHIGFLHSSDMGRMSIVTEAGEPASEEYTFAIIASQTYLNTQ